MAISIPGDAKGSGSAGDTELLQELSEHEMQREEGRILKLHEISVAGIFLLSVRTGDPMIELETLDLPAAPPANW